MSASAEPCHMSLLERKWCCQVMFPTNVTKDFQQARNDTPFDTQLSNIKLSSLVPAWSHDHHELQSDLDAQPIRQADRRLPMPTSTKSFQLMPDSYTSATFVSEHEESDIYAIVLSCSSFVGCNLPQARSRTGDFSIDCCKDVDKLAGRVLRERWSVSLWHLGLTGALFAGPMCIMVCHDGLLAL